MAGVHSNGVGGMSSRVGGGSAVLSGPRCAFSRSEERGRGGGTGVDIT